MQLRSSLTVHTASGWTPPPTPPPPPPPQHPMPARLLTHLPRTVGWHWAVQSSGMQLPLGPSAPRCGTATAPSPSGPEVSLPPSQTHLPHTVGWVALGRAVQWCAAASHSDCVHSHWPDPPLPPPPLQGGKGWGQWLHTSVADCQLAQITPPAAPPPTPNNSLPPPPPPTPSNAPAPHCGLALGRAVQWCAAASRAWAHAAALPAKPSTCFISCRHAVLRMQQQHTQKQQQQQQQQ